MSIYTIIPRLQAEELSQMWLATGLKPGSSSLPQKGPLRVILMGRLGRIELWRELRWRYSWSMPLDCQLY